MTISAPTLRSEQDELQALIEEARRRARRRRRRNGIVVATVAIIAAGACVLFPGLSAHQSSVGGRSGRPLPTLPGRVPGAFWYTRTIGSLQLWMPTFRVEARRGTHLQRPGPEVLFDIRESEETWVGADGTARDRVVLLPRFATAAGRATWKAYGESFNFNKPGWMAHDTLVMRSRTFPPQLLYPWGEALSPAGLDLGDSLFSFKQLLALPSNPTALLSQLQQAEEALGRRFDRGARPLGDGGRTRAVNELTDIGWLVACPLPTSVRLALLRAAARLPGARVNWRARDSLRRPGVTVSVTAGMATQRLVFDPATGALRQRPDGAVVTQGPVGSVYALPHGTSPISAPGAPAEPPTLAVSPAVGTPRTVFRLEVSAPGWGRLSKPPSLDWMIGGTPRSRCFTPRFPQPLVSSAAFRGPGRLAYVYLLSPSQLQRRSWCPGRYELNIVPDYSGRTHTSYSQAAGSPTVDPGTGSSTFLQVR